ncbi:MAG: hypothetical protein ACREHG_03375, partial [Candidatus Saccharimonadales bacterium]
NAQSLMSTAGYVFYVLHSKTATETKYLRQGDWIGYANKKGIIKHISMAYSIKPDANNNYKIIHAFGPPNDVFDDDGNKRTPAVFGRMVIVTRGSIKTPYAYGRIRLWN